MKQRHHRKAVQRRMREAPTQYDRDCQFYGDVTWTKRERKAIAKGEPVPLMFNRIHMIAPTQIAGRTIRKAGQPDVFIVTDHYSVKPYQQAIIDALETGMGWVRLNAAGNAEALSRSEVMKP